jgi:hypothetical protein
MTYMAQPGRLRRSGRSLKTNEKSVETNLTNRLTHKNSDTPDQGDKKEKMRNLLLEFS